MAAAAAAAAAEKGKDQSDEGPDTNGKSSLGKVSLPPNDIFFFFLGFEFCGLDALNSTLPDQLRVFDLFFFFRFFRFFVFFWCCGGVFLSCFFVFFGPSGTTKALGPSARSGGYRSRDEGSIFG